MTDRGAPTLPRALVRLMLAVGDAYEDAGREVGLTAQQAQLLCLARRSASVGELAEAMRCDRSNISRMVDRAAARGLVARRPGAADARVSMIELTDDGTQVMQRFLETLDGRIGRVAAAWPASRRELALGVLDELAAALEPERPVPEPQRDLRAL